MEEVQVFDNVFDEYSAGQILALEENFKAEGFSKFHCYFERKKTPYRLAVEYLLDEICRRMKDDSPIIEYWTRTTWLNMECHQDINEHINKKSRELLMPNYGHVLYLDNTGGPTMIFNENFTNVSCVPPRLGRMTRFKGDLFHSVPCPWEFNFEKKEPNKGWRPVLLFNTWSEYEHYPTFELMKVSFEDILLCQEQWREIMVPYIPLERPLMMYVQLMGDTSRRRNRQKTELYYAPESIRDPGELACYEIEKVT